MTHDEEETENTTLTHNVNGVVKLSHLGGQIPYEIHQLFKKKVKERGENVAMALQHAALLYIHADDTITLEEAPKDESDH